MSYTIQFEKAALKFLQKQDKPTRERLIKAINILPNGTDIKKLQGYNNLYRTRVGNIRILYSIKETLKIINIENIDKLFKLLKDKHESKQTSKDKNKTDFDNMKYNFERAIFTVKISTFVYKIHLLKNRKK